MRLTIKEFKRLIVTGMVLSLWHLPAYTQDSVAERLANLERRIQYLEDRVATQGEVIFKKDRQIAKLMEHGVQVEQEEGWFDSVEVGGLLEVEAAYENPHEGDSSSDAVLATMKLAVTAQVTEWVGGEVVLLHEEDDTGLEVDVAIMTVGPADGPYSFTAGQYFVPFGTFESNFISDPMTLELGETRESALQFGIESGRFQGAVYAFNGDSDDRFENVGAMLGFAAENENSEFAVNVSYISNIGDTDSLQDAIKLDEDYDSVSGWSASGMLRFGSLSFLAEYLGASEDFEANEMEFDGDGAEPSSYLLEAAYGFDLAGKSSAIAVGYQETDEALALGLPEERFMLGFSVEMMEGVTLAIEGAFDDDYSVSDGGTGKDAEIVTVQLASEF